MRAEDGRLRTRFGVLGGVTVSVVVMLVVGAGYLFLNGVADARHETATTEKGGYDTAALAAMAAQAGNTSSSLSGEAETEADATLQTASLPIARGPASGLPLPRFVSLKRDKVRVRRGPSREYSVAWVYHARGLPVEVVAEFGNWRRIRDADGSEGWVLRTLLSGWRTAMVAPWNKSGLLALRDAPNGRIIARVKSGVIGKLKECNGQWCRLVVHDIEGWIEQDALWGVYPEEKFAAAK